MKNLFLLVILLLIAGCNDFTSSERYTGDYYVITGLLYEGMPLMGIFVGKTISPYGDSLSSMNVPDAEVFIMEYDAEKVILDSIFLVYQEFEEGIGFYVPEELKLIEAGNIYEVEVRINGEIIIAETQVPNSISVLPDTSFTLDSQMDDFPNLVYETADAEHPLIIITENDDPVNLKFEFYCLEEFEDEPQYIISFGEHTSPEEEDEYENPVNGSPRRIEYYGAYLPTLNENGEYIITEQSYSGPIVFYGDYRITISSMSPSYYNYLYMSDGYTHGGIQNGFGYFGAVSSVSLYTEVIE